MVLPDNRNAPPNPSRAKTTHSEAALRRALKGAPQDLWLDTVRRTRGKPHQRLVYWMLCQPECDFAVAASAFYRSDPVKHIKKGRPLTPRPGPAHLFDLVLLNWDTGSFRNHNLRVDPEDIASSDLKDINDAYQTQPQSALPFRIPPQLLNPKGGTAAYVPAHLSPDDAPHLWPLFAHMDLNVPAQPPGLHRKLEQAKDLLRKVGLSSQEGTV